MSFSDFDKGLTADEVRRKRLNEKAEDHMQEQLRKWSESERILNMLRKIKASKEAMQKGDLKQWLEATSGLI